jgi:hypothetical protein
MTLSGPQMTPPLPENLKLNLRARKRSLEDQDDLI